MSTRRQRAASRANGQKSQGPITPAGKAKSRYNALKHGIDAKQQVMFGESAEDLAELAAEYHDLYSPANADERFLVDTLINNEWRLRRLRCVEAGLWQAGEAGKSGLGDAFTASRAFDRLQRIMNSCQRQYDHARRELQLIVAARPHSQPEEPATTSASPGSFYTAPPNPLPQPAAEPHPAPVTPAVYAAGSVNAADHT